MATMRNESEGVMFGKTLLFSGGKTDLEFAREYLEQYSFDTVVCADSGLEAAHALQLPVKYIMGDFDSVSKQVMEQYRRPDGDGNRAEFVQYPTAKDATDTEMVLQWLVEQKPEEIVILGATGGRLDHLLANIQILMHPLAANIPAYIIDRNNRLFLADHTVILHRQDLFGRYISLQPLTECVKSVTLRGLKYTLEDYTLTIGSSRAVSNEIAAEAEYAEIAFTEGVLIVIESRD